MSDFKKHKVLSIDDTLGKMPPSAIDLEEAVLGAIMLEKDAFSKVYTILKPESFFKESHQKIYQAIQRLFEANSGIDLLTVTEKLRENGWIEEVGGPYYITQLTSKVASAAHIEYHARIIAQKFIQREYIRVSQEIQKVAFDEEIDVEDLIDIANDKIDRIMKDANMNDSIKAAIKEAEVSLDEVIEDGEVVFSIRDENEYIPVLTKGNISTVIGKAKSRKTYLVTMITGAIIAKVLFNKLFGRGGYKIAYFDTEQGRKRTQKILERIFRLCDLNCDGLRVFSLRKYDKEERIKIIDTFISENKPDFVVIDGIRDLILDINDPTEATIVTTYLMKWSEIYNCHIMNVLHQNKGDSNARGHVGTEIVNKSETVISANKIKGSDFTTVECEYMRGMEFDEFQFFINSEGLPEIEVDPNFEPVSDQEILF